jgi:hypothetical protein
MHWKEGRVDHFIKMIFNHSVMKRFLKAVDPSFYNCDVSLATLPLNSLRFSFLELHAQKIRQRKNSPK